MRCTNKLFAVLVALLTAFSVSAGTIFDVQHLRVEVVGSGKPVLLIPGFTSDQRVWNDVAEELAARYQVHRVSLPGFGTTAAVANPSLAKSKQALLDYIKQQGLSQPAVIGHSLGGFMGFWLETSAPMSIGPVVSVDGLPFIGPLFSREPVVNAESMKPQADYMKNFYAGLDGKGMVAAASQGIGIQARSKDDQTTILEMARLSDPATAANAIYTLMTTDLRQDLAKANSPMLLIGASGGFADAGSKAFQKALYQGQLTAAPEARVAMHAQSRHFIMYDDPEWLTAQLSDFLQEAL